MTSRFPGVNLQITAATLLLLLGLLSFRELIPMGNGLGYDGREYGAWTQHLSVEMLLTPVNERPKDFVVDSYRVRRILVPIALHYVLRALDVYPTRPVVIATWTIANILFLSVAMFLWCLAADVLAIGTAGKWMGFLALMVNYVNAKMPLFYPVLLDSAAVAFGAGMLLLYLRRWRIALMVATGLGGFVWPSLPYFGFLMIAFPQSQSPGPPEPAPYRLDRIAAAAAAATGLALIAFLLGAGYDMAATPVEPLRSVAFLSAAWVAVYLYLGLRPLLDSKRVWLDLAPTRVLRNPWLWAALLVHGLSLVLLTQIPTSPTPMGARQAIGDNFMSAVAQPGIGFVAHALHYGPLVLLLLLLWSPISENLRRQGTGLILCFALAVVIGAGSESRKLMNFYPVIVLFLVQVAEPFFASRGRMLALGALSLFFSKVWLPMAEPLRVPVFGVVGWREVYVSSRGPWIEHGWWAVQGLVVVAVGAWLYFGYVRGGVRRPLVQKLAGTDA